MRRPSNFKFQLNKVQTNYAESTSKRSPTGHQSSKSLTSYLFTHL